MGKKNLKAKVVNIAAARRKFRRSNIKVIYTKILDNLQPQKKIKRASGKPAVKRLGAKNMKATKKRNQSYTTKKVNNKRARMVRGNLRKQPTRKRAVSFAASSQRKPLTTRRPNFPVNKRARMVRSNLYKQPIRKRAVAVASSLRRKPCTPRRPLIPLNNKLARMVRGYFCKQPTSQRAVAFPASSQHKPRTPRRPSTPYKLFTPRQPAAKRCRRA